MKSFDRPFPQFIGNDGAKNQIAAYLQSGQFPHALLIEGPTGSGKKTLARLIAGAAVCENAEERPCGRCAGCRKAAENIHPDVEEFSGTGGERSFHIDTVRVLRHNAYILPNEAEKRVMILSNAHQMTPQAQNALLKILEEPPAHLLFILTCENRAQLLPTIRSRVTVLSLTGVSFEEAYPLLKEKLPEADEGDLRRTFTAFGGVIGPVLSGFADKGLSKALDLLPRMAKALLSPDDWELIALTGEIEKDKETVKEVLNGLHLLFRDALMLHYGSTATLSTAPDAARTLSAALSGTRLTALIKEVEGLQEDTRRNMNQALLLSRLVTRLRSAAIG